MLKLSLEKPRTSPPVPGDAIPLLSPERGNRALTIITLHIKWRSGRELHVRTLAAIIMWIVVALLVLNMILRSGTILFISIAMLLVAVLVYFIPRLRK